MVTIGVVGYGYVGKAVEFGFKSKNKVIIHDKFLPSDSLGKVIKGSAYVFVCVPTPMDAKYTKIDISIVDEVVGEIVRLARGMKAEPAIVIKSTVVPGTTRRLAQKYHWRKMLFNPEFLTQANFLQDFVNADRIVIGGDNDQVSEGLLQLYRESFPSTKIFQTDSTTAEMVKYMANTYLATKVIFANEMSDLCNALGIKYEEMKKMVVADHRIYDSHLDITTERGFGWKCFPKDTVAILGLAHDLHVELSVLESAWKKNLRIRRVRDWEEIPGAVSGKEKQNLQKK